MDTSDFSRPQNENSPMSRRLHFALSIAVQVHGGISPGAHEIIRAPLFPLQRLR